MSKLSPLMTFHREYLSISMMVWMSLFLVVLLVWYVFSEPGQILVGTLYPCMFTAYTFFTLIKREKLLSERKGKNAGLIWDVYVNNVPQGKISDADYSDIEHVVLFDASIWRAQLYNIFRVVIGMANQFFMVFPAIFFWVAVCSYFFAPDFFVQGVDILQKISPDEIQNYVPLLCEMLFFVIFMGVAFSILLGIDIGFRDIFKKEHDTLVLRELKCAANGEIYVGVRRLMPDDITFGRLNE